MESKFKETHEMIFRYKDHKDALIRKTVIQLCSTLAVFDPDQFVSMYLKVSMNYLIGQLKKDRDRSACKSNCFFIIYLLLICYLFSLQPLWRLVRSRVPSQIILGPTWTLF